MRSSLLGGPASLAGLLISSFAVAAAAPFSDPLWDRLPLSTGSSTRQRAVVNQPTQTTSGAVSSSVSASASASPTPSPANVPQCLSLNTSSICAPLTTGNFFINTTELSLNYNVSITSVAQWESLIVNSTTASSDGSSLFQLLWTQFTGCTAPEAASLPYLRTIACLGDVYGASNGCNQQAIAANPTPLCPGVCRSYGAAIASYLQNATCSTNATDIQTAHRNGLAKAQTACLGFATATADNVCLAGIQYDSSTCGFGNNSVGLAEYCQVHSSESCCTKLDPTNPPANSSDIISLSSSSEKSDTRSSFGSWFKPAPVDSSESTSHQLNAVAAPAGTASSAAASQATPAIDNDALNRLKLGAGGAAPFQLNAAAASSDTSSPTDSPPPTSGSSNTGVFIGIGSAAGVLGVAGAAYAAFRNKLFKKSYAAASQKADEPFSTKLNIMKPSFSAPSSSSSSSSASRSTAPTVGQDGKATHPFRATLPDELNVSVGDVITVEEDFGDNWGRCRNVFSNAVGVAPLTIFVRK